MASLSQLISTNLPCPTKRASSASPSCPLPPAQARASLSQTSRRSSPAISCKANNQNNQELGDSLNRRNVLIGLGGLYGAAAAVNTNHLAKADPVMTPDVAQCGVAEKIPPGAVPTGCCPPASIKAPKVFTPLGAETPLRVRPAAHLADQAYMDKFREAMRRMKALPDTDPRSFRQQAMIHCAYCNGAYKHGNLGGIPPVELQVHFSWLFFPFHRCYLYFFERILGSLIDDPSFAIPFWNWDSAAGMSMPVMYANARNNGVMNPLYNVFRNPNHRPPKKISLNYFHEGSIDEHLGFTEEQLVHENLSIMYREMRENGKTPELFFGNPYRAGSVHDEQKGAGPIERGPHTCVHVWVGDHSQPNWEDMGNFYSAGRDPLFYALHGNVDRLWNVWKSLDTRNVDICDPDYLNASFLLYDENKELVRIKVADCLDSERLMRYKYQDVPIEWLEMKPKVTLRSAAQPKSALMNAQFPLVLESPVRATVRRPKTNRTAEEKAAKEEVLKIGGIELNRDAPAKFDVFVNADNHENVASDGREFIGSFTNIPHKHTHDQMDMGIVTSVQFGLTSMIDDLGVDGDETIEVTLVPRVGQGKVTVSSITIGFTG